MVELLDTFGTLYLVIAAVLTDLRNR